MERGSLQELCLNRIAKDIQFWCGDAENENFNVYLYVLGPFDHLGSRQIRDLINILAKKKVLKTSYLQSLLHGGIKSLDLSPCNYLVSDTVVKMISGRCQKLCHLAMPNCKRLSVCLLQNLVSNLPSLRSLDLSGCTSCNDSVLLSLAKNCEHLHVLKLESCKEVTDEGLSFLNKNTKILELKLSGTRVTADGALKLLQNHQHLQSLSLATCSSKQQNFFSDSFLTLQTTRLRCLDLSNTNVDDHSVVNISKICPSICTLNLSGCHNTTGASLVHLQTLEQLEHLELDASSINCSLELPDFLRIRGSQLIKLHLVMSSGIDTGVIAQYCPNLLDLCLADSTDVLSSSSQKYGREFTLLEACPNLKFLDLQSCTFSDVKNLDEHFASIFCPSVSHMEVLNLAHVRDITDECLASLIKSSFGKLRILNISSCDLITVELVLKVVQHCKHLEYLNVRDCWKVHRCDIERAQALARNLQRAVEIKWQ